jgi:multiple sugar transport system substrate-binding protein
MRYKTAEPFGVGLVGPLAALALGAILLVSAAATPAAAASCDKPVDLRFTYWGTAFEKHDIEAATESFNASHPCIHVEAQHIPYTGYAEKLTTMLAAGAPPDVAYLAENQAFPWAQEGKILDLTKYFAKDPGREFVKSTVYHCCDNKVLMGTGLATGVMLLYYNKDLFDAANMPYPPSKASEAWTWDKFLDVAKKLTKDRNGHSASDAAFDPNSIDTYGVTFGTWWGGWLPFVFSNGGKFADDQGTKLLLNQPAAVEALQAMQNLIYVDHVAPSPVQSQTMPTADILMQSRKVAMAIDGMWKVTDFANLHMHWGMAALPKFKEPMTVIVSNPKVIFSATKHPDEAFEFYKYIADPEKVALFSEGLWAPMELEYYTVPAKIDSWLKAKPGVYPPEAMDDVVDYTLHHSPYQSPVYWLKNVNRITNEAVTPATDQIFNSDANVQKTMDEAVAKSAPLMQGRW